MCPNRQFPGDLVTFTGEILNEKLHFLCSVMGKNSNPIFLNSALFFNGNCLPIKVCLSEFFYWVFMSGNRRQYSLN